MVRVGLIGYGYAGPVSRKRILRRVTRFERASQQFPRSRIARVVTHRRAQMFYGCSCVAAFQIFISQTETQQRIVVAAFEHFQQI